MPHYDYALLGSDTFLTAPKKITAEFSRCHYCQWPKHKATWAGTMQNYENAISNKIRLRATSVSTPYPEHLRRWWRPQWSFPHTRSWRWPCLPGRLSTESSVLPCPPNVLPSTFEWSATSWGLNERRPRSACKATSTGTNLLQRLLHSAKQGRLESSDLGSCSGWRGKVSLK